MFLSHDRSSVPFPLTGAELEAKATQVNTEVSEMVPYLALICSYASGTECNTILFAANCPRNMPPQRALGTSAVRCEQSFIVFKEVQLDPCQYGNYFCRLGPAVLS